MYIGVPVGSKAYRAFEAIATELRAESAGNVCAMDLEAADALQTTLVRKFARARMQEIYDTISSTVHQADAHAPELSPIHSSATRHLVHRLIGMFSSLSKKTLNDGLSDDNVSQDIADLHCKCQCIIHELRTKRDGSPVAAAERDLINQKISDICVAKHVNIVFEQLETEAEELATWAAHHRQESSEYFKRIRDISIEEIDATRPATHLQRTPYVAPEHVRKARRLNES
jgi:hypothetical protein